MFAVFDGQLFGNIQLNIPDGFFKETNDLPDEMDAVSQVNERQPGSFQILLIKNIQIGQEVCGLEMSSNHRAKLGWNVFGFIFDTAHAADQAVFTDRYAQAIKALAHFWEGFVI